MMKSTIIKALISILVAGLFLAPTALSQTMDEAVDEAVSILSDRGLNDHEKEEMILEVLNYHSHQFDREARKIQSSLYTALQTQFPQAKILLLEEAIAGVSARAVLIKVTYQAQETINLIEIKAIKQMNGLMIAKADAAYYVEREKFENLVAVIPLEAPALGQSATQTLSKIFRSALTKTGAFNLISSDVIDSADADEIQKQYQCSREECSAIVAEQVNASQVITTQYHKIAEGLFYLTASLKDIKTGRTIREEAIQHNGDIKTLPNELENLALKIAGQDTFTNLSGQTGMMFIKSVPTEATIFVDGVQQSQKTDNIFQNIPIGKHEITVYKGDLGAKRSIIVQLDEIAELDLNLTELSSELRVKSKPTGDVYLDGQRVGTTPLVIDVSVGRHELEIQKEGYQTSKQVITIQPFKNSQINTKLIRTVDFLIAVSPPSSKVEVDGEVFDNGIPDVFESVRNIREIPLKLTKGKHEIKVSHQEATRPVTQWVDLSEDGEDTIKISLALKQEYLVRLRWESARRVYDSEMNSWRKNLWLSLAGSIAVGLYSVYEIKNTEDARTLMLSYEDQLLAAASYAEAQMYDDLANAQLQKIADHNQRTRIGAGISTILVGLAFWFWIDEPEPPKRISWEMAPTIPTSESVGLAWHVAW